MIPSWNPPFTYLLISGKPRISDDQIVTSLTFSHSIPWYPEHIAPWYPTLGLQNKNRRIGRWSKAHPRSFAIPCGSSSGIKPHGSCLAWTFRAVYVKIFILHIYIHIKAQYIQYVYHIYSLYMLIYIYMYGNMCNILKFIFRGYFFDRQLRCCKARMRICHEISKGWLTYRPWRGKQCFDLAGWSNVPLISYKSGWWFGTRFILP
jgi:hypothetical protein